MARPVFVMEWAEVDTEEALKERYREERDAARRTWLHALWLLRQGRKVQEVADLVGASKRSVDRWVDWYRTGGRAGVLAHHQGGSGRAPALTPEQQTTLAEAVATGQFRTARDIQAWLRANFAVSLQVSSIHKLLARLRCAPKVPRPQHEKTDPAAQQAWKKGGLLLP